MSSDKMSSDVAQQKFYAHADFKKLEVTLHMRTVDQPSGLPVYG